MGAIFWHGTKLLPIAFARAQPDDPSSSLWRRENLIGQGLVSMSMIDPKGSRPSALVILASLQRSGKLKLVKTEARNDSDKRSISSNDNYPSDITQYDNSEA
jgi:hypothetical protein